MITINGWRMIIESAGLLWKSWYDSTSPAPPLPPDIGIQCTVKGSVLTLRFNTPSPAFSEGTFLSVHNAVVERTFSTSYSGDLYLIWRNDFDLALLELQPVIPGHLQSLVNLAFKDLSPNPKEVCCKSILGTHGEPDRSPDFFYPVSHDATIFTTVGGIRSAVSPVPALVSSVSYNVTLQSPIYTIIDPDNDPTF